MKETVLDSESTSIININLIVIGIFMVFNPIYAITLTALLGVITKKINNFLLGVLYVISLALVFSNQDFMGGTDLGNYISIYHSTKLHSFSGLFDRYLNDVLGKEVLWLYYSKTIGLLTNYSTKLFILSTYVLIFSLSAYVSFLISDQGRYSFSLLLYFLVFIDLSFIYGAYNMWRNIIAVLIFLIGMIRHDRGRQVFTSRIIMYSSMFVHSSLLLAIALYEFFVFFFTNYRYKSVSYYIKVMFALILLVFILSSITSSFVNNISINTSLSSGVNKYLYGSSDEFVIPYYLRPLYIIFFSYIIYNIRQLHRYEIFITVIFIILTVMPYLTDVMQMVYSRASLIPSVAIILMSSKVFKRLPVVYSFVIIYIFFIYRISTYIDLDFPLENIAKGDLLNFNYGLVSSIFYHLLNNYCCYLQ